MRSNRKSRRRYRKFAWIFGSSAIVIALLYWEQTPVLYVLSTLAMCALLLVVAFSNLEARDKELHQTALKIWTLGMPNQRVPYQRRIGWRKD